MSRQTKGPKDRIVFGFIVVPPLGTSSPFRNPMCAWALAETVFKRDQPRNLTRTILVEDAELTNSALSNDTWIGFASIEDMEGGRALLIKKRGEIVSQPAQQPVAHTADKQGSLIDIHIGSKEFCVASFQYAMALVTIAESELEAKVVARLNWSEPGDVFWVDALKKPYDFHETDASDMMCQNIGSMVL